MAEALAIKNSEIEALVSATDGLKKQDAISEGNLASLQALREELASAERRAEEKHAAHNASKMVCLPPGKTDCMSTLQVPFVIPN
ncbi:hypothetical protein FNV43_RR24708 [Rhamnella rubrinervis]|uniref:Uncharacterized protein n=1 Tax=Rhamnella rubrinervis TaxID=2594499 RepID=A0A8K0DRQ4_9ROSA|nr:hypothetical protein FNV43_RR24708 [Rhamnella rubrinervis]